MAAEAKLIDTLLEIAADSGNRIMERRMADLSVWYYRNRGGLARDNLAGRQDFTEKAIWILIELIALQQDRIHELEARGKSKSLYLPSGVTLNGRRFG